MSNIVIFNLFFGQRDLLVYALKPAAARVRDLVYFGQVKLAVFLYLPGIHGYGSGGGRRRCWCWQRGLLRNN